MPIDPNVQRCQRPKADASVLALAVQSMDPAPMIASLPSCAGRIRGSAEQSLVSDWDIVRSPTPVDSLATPFASGQCPSKTSAQQAAIRNETSAINVLLLFTWLVNGFNLCCSQTTKLFFRRCPEVRKRSHFLTSSPLLLTPVHSTALLFQILSQISIIFGYSIQIIDLNEWCSSAARSSCTYSRRRVSTRVFPRMFSDGLLFLVFSLSHTYPTRGISISVLLLTHRGVLSGSFHSTVRLVR